jgi:aldehyde:ferredoxin oxidoreductase
MDHTAIEGQVAASRNGQRAMAGLDSLGVCIFTGGGWATSGSAMSDLLNARYGWNVDNSIQLKLGQETIDMEREFNRQAGFTKADDRLPEWMTREALPPLNVVFDVPNEEMDTVFEW